MFAPQGWLFSLFRSGMSPYATDGACTPAMREIAQATGVARNTVRKALAELEARGWVIRQRYDCPTGYRYGYALHVGVLDG